MKKLFKTPIYLIKPPFENLNNDFKETNTETKEVFMNSNPIAALALSVVLYQIIEFNLVNSDDETRTSLKETRFEINFDKIYLYD